jgi:hypothetical protein
MSAKRGDRWPAIAELATKQQLSSGARNWAAPGSPFPAQGLGPFGGQFRPTNARQLFVSNAHNPFTVNGGSLTELPTSPTPAPVSAAPTSIVVT